MKKKTTIYILAIIIVLLTIFNVVVTQTDLIPKYFGIYLNSTPVLVTTKTFYENDLITADGVKVKYISTDLILKNSDETDSSAFILTDVSQLEQGLVAKETILSGEQIPVKRLMPYSELTNKKNKTYTINVDYLGAAGNTLYVGDNVELWYKYKDKDAFKTEKLFEEKITISRLKNSDGLDINKNRNEPAVIPTIAFVRVDDEDIKKIEELTNNGATFFFVKDAV